MTYKFRPGGVLLVEQNAGIPNDPDNTDWQKYLAFVAGGGTTLPADQPPSPSNAAAFKALQRAQTLDDLTQKVSRGATQGEINAALLNFLKG